MHLAEQRVFATIATNAVDWSCRSREFPATPRTSRLMLTGYSVLDQSTLRDWNGAFLALDGPFAETKEFVLG